MSKLEKHELIIRRAADELNDLASTLSTHGWTYPASQDFFQLVQDLRTILVDIKLEQPKR